MRGLRERVKERRLPRAEREAARAERRAEEALRRERDNTHTPERRAGKVDAEARRWPPGL
jgi:hypothetical protein